MVVALLIFTTSLWLAFFFFFVALIQRIIKPEIGSLGEEWKGVSEILVLSNAGLIYALCFITAVGSITIACKGWARKFIITTDFMFHNTLIIHCLTTVVVCIPEYAKYRSDPRECVIAMSVVTFGSSLVFLFRSAAQGGAGTAKVMSTASFVSFMSCFTQPDFPVKGNKLTMNKVVLGLTSALGACYLYCSPEAPLVKLEVEAEAPEEDDNERSALIQEAEHEGDIELVPLAAAVRME
ncbi:hypothetical protein LguiB_022413 [Lonicera macranthoides]